MALAELVDRSTGSDPYSEGYAFIRVRGAFSPDLIEARAGERLRLILRREETAECSERLIFPSLGRSVMLPPFEDVAIDLGPLPRGSHPFSCELGVLRGSIVARGAPAQGSGKPRMQEQQLARMHLPGPAPTLRRKSS